MSKILTDKEMGQIIHSAVTDPGVIDDQDSYIHFLEDLSSLISDHFGGDDSAPTVYDDELGYTVAFQVNECVPSDGGVFKDYDTDVTWRDGVETQ